MQDVSTRAESAARHSRGATKSIRGIAWRFFVRLRWQYYPLLLSDYGREILRRKYDAIATDRAYENRPSGLLGPIGRWVDQIVLNFPTHEGLRQRLRIVVDYLKSQIEQQRQLNETPGQSRGHTPIRVLSAPCGLARDILTCATELRSGTPRTAQSVEFHALDLDATGEVLPIASQRAAALHLPVRFYRDDLFNPRELEPALRTGTRFHIVNCIGLTAWLDLSDVERLARYLHDKVLMHGGVLIVDNFTRHRFSSLAKDLEIYTQYHAPAAFEAALERCGFHVVEKKTTTNNVNTVYVARTLDGK